MEIPVLSFYGGYGAGLRQCKMQNEESESAQEPQFVRTGGLACGLGHLGISQEPPKLDFARFGEPLVCPPDCYSTPSVSLRYPPEKAW